jgi:GNAT superfamily N-acetyltransferase
MPALRIERVHGPARREIAKGLYAYNEMAGGKPNYRRLTITVRHRGRVIGGLAAEMYWGWMYVSLLWMVERHRAAGWGKSLLRAAEAEARKHGVRRVFLESFTFQAPGFYKKLGYREFARLKQFPRGHDRVSLTKAL